jgi:hypothetical protein
VFVFDVEIECGEAEVDSSALADKTLFNLTTFRASLTLQVLFFRVNSLLGGLMEFSAVGHLFYYF